MNVTRARRGVATTVEILALVVGLSLIGCGSGGERSEPVGLLEDIMLFPGGADDSKLGDLGERPPATNNAGINLGTSGHFHYRMVLQGEIDNHWFMTKSGVSYQVEVIGDGEPIDVDLYLGRSVHPYSAGYWKCSIRSYPLMDGIVFKSAQDGIMYVDVFGRGGYSHIGYLVHVRKCQFGTFSQ